MSDTGILYIASGESYINEMIDSAQSIHDNVGEINIAAVVDRNLRSDLFSDVIRVDETVKHEGIKLEGLRKTPFETTIFLDTDTYVTRDITDLFDLMERFDIGVAHAPRREAESVGEYPESGLPDAIPEFNTGVIVYANNKVVQDFFDHWEQIYGKHTAEGITHDQPSFRKAIFENESIRLTVLPPEYNYRFVYPQFADLQVKILHGRHPEIEMIENAVNAVDGYRVSRYVNGNLEVDN